MDRIRRTPSLMRGSPRCADRSQKKPGMKATRGGTRITVDATTAHTGLPRYEKGREMLVCNRCGEAIKYPLDHPASECAKKKEWSK